MTKDFVSEHIVKHYDEHIRQLIPGYVLVHQHIQALLYAHSNEQAKHVLIIGCGTGYELEYLLTCFPNWKFVACDLSATMLAKAHARIQAIGKEASVEFICGDFAAHCSTETFDLVLSVLVSHFVAHKDKQTFFAQIADVLKQHGMFLTFDLMAFQQQNEVQILQYIVQQQGLTARQTTVMLERLKDDYAVLTEVETRQYFQQAGLENTQKFIQLAGYSGFYAFKA